MADKMMRVAGRNTIGNASPLRIENGELQVSQKKDNDEIVRHVITPDDWLEHSDNTLYVGKGLGNSREVDMLDVRPYTNKTFVLKNEFNRKIDFRIWTSLSRFSTTTPNRIYTINEDWYPLENEEYAILSPMEYSGLGVNQSYMFVQIRYDEGNSESYEHLKTAEGQVRVLAWGGI